MKILQLIHKCLIDYNLFIAICTVSFFHFCSQIFGISYPVELYLFGFFSTLATYNLFRYYNDFKQFVVGNQSVRFWIVVISLLIALICFLFFEIDLKLAFCCLGFLTFFYKFDLIWKIHLRKVPFLKLPIIVFVWVISGCIFSLLNPALKISNNQVWIFIGIQSLYFAAISIPFDVLGLIEDNIVTIPSKIGVKRAFLFSKILMAFAIGIAFFFAHNSFFQLPFLLFAGITIMFIQLCESLKNKYLQFYLLDGSILLQTIIFLLCDF